MSGTQANALKYDENGNLAGTYEHAYDFDAENRLVGIWKAPPANPANPGTGLSCADFDMDGVISLGDLTMMLARLPVKRGRLIPFAGYRLWQRIHGMATRAGIRGVHPHLLRHSFAILFLERSEGDAFALQDILGHARPEQTGYYVRSLRRQSALNRQRAVDVGGAVFGDGAARLDAARAVKEDSMGIVL